MFGAVFFVVDENESSLFIEDSLLLTNHRRRGVGYGSECRLASRKKMFCAQTAEQKRQMSL
jgi:hypothetical protein